MKLATYLVPAFVYSFSEGQAPLLLWVIRPSSQTRPHELLASVYDKLV
jgi:hypothetical protein